VPRIVELAAGETGQAATALLELRTNIASAEELVRQVDDLMRPQGYRLLASFEDGVDHAVAAAGFRPRHMLYVGSHLYIDDLVTLPDYRRRGHAEALLKWVADEARGQGHDQVHLDSGTPRHDAHRRYLTAGYRITSFHFVQDV
jgi:GNAT superfamily N-acetyltransferase